MAKIDVDVEAQVIPLVQLVRMAITAEQALREIDGNRRHLPTLDACLKSLGCLTDLGESVADDVGMVLTLVVQMLQAEQDHA